MMFPKSGKVRLKGKALAKLNSDIHERDGNRCIICGKWVDQGEKFHHEPCGADKQDRIECGVTLCGDCHYKRHFTEWLNVIKEKCEEYLRGLYPAFWKMLKKRGE